MRTRSMGTVVKEQSGARWRPEVGRAEPGKIGPRAVRLQGHHAMLEIGRRAFATPLRERYHPPGQESGPPRKAEQGFTQVVRASREERSSQSVDKEVPRVLGPQASGRGFLF